MVETMTTEEVADLLKVTQPTVYRWVRDGQLSALRVGRTLRFDKAEVERMVRGTEETPSMATPTPDGVEALVSMLADEVEKELRRRGTIQ